MTLGARFGGLIIIYIKILIRCFMLNSRPNYAVDGQIRAMAPTFLF